MSWFNPFRSRRRSYGYRPQRRVYGFRPRRSSGFNRSFGRRRFW
jgi:hypothetical protein